MSDTLVIRSIRHSYNVNFTDDFEQILQDSLIPTDIILIDTNVHKIYKERLNPILKTHRHKHIVPSEKLKEYSQLQPIIEWLIENGFKKNQRLVAIGGGITQDITSFIASIIYRGVDWIFIPTTLLAQCDSCIGSKTSINFGKYKNQLGGFYPPKDITIDPCFMNSLQEEEIRSGIGEMIHYFLVSGRDDFDRITREHEEAFQNTRILTGLIRRSLEIKKSYVEKDEFDQGPRNVFNYGHSFGHAIESLTNYAVPHGIAVSFGMDIANAISCQQGLISDEILQETRTLLKKNWSGTSLNNINIEEFINILKKDKKNTDSEIRVILTKGLGCMFKTQLPIADPVLECISECLNKYSRQTNALTAT